MPGLGVVVGQRRGVLGLRLGVEALDGVGDGTMDLAAARHEERAVGDVLGEGVVERVGGLELAGTAHPPADQGALFEGMEVERGPLVERGDEAL